MKKLEVTALLTHLQYLVGCICFVVIEESVVDHMTCPLPEEWQLDGLDWCGGPLCEALQGVVLQQRVVTDSTEEVDLKNNHLKL